MNVLQLQFVLLLISWLSVASAATVNQTDTKPGCQPKCGNVNIPYPFGIGEKCSQDDWANIYCNTTFNPPKPFIGNLEVVHFSLTEVRIKNNIARNCYDKSGMVTNYEIASEDLYGSPYTFSSTKNKITAIGCDTLMLVRLNTDNNTAACTTRCNKIEDVIVTQCSGMGCCEMSIPRGLKMYRAFLTSSNNYTKVWSFNPCGVAFLGEQGMYNLKTADFSNSTALLDIPIVLNFALGNQTCKVAKRNATSYACKDNSYCYDSVDDAGYLCSCNKGFEGNPYLQQSCQDVNECEDPNNNPCDGNCINTLGSYYCSCPPGSHGDGRKDGTHCTRRNKAFPIIPITLGLAFGFIFLLVCGSWLYLGMNKRRQFKLKEKFFEQNGGLLLKEQISSNAIGLESTQIFTAEELKQATSNYDESQILGQGGNGTVYKGVLTDKRTVAIKRSKVIDESQLGQFINEVVILTQINHRNVVKLLGCCLETQVPVLVYEYISKGTLYDLLHKRGTKSSISWEERLRIAAETAGALAYLHSSASIQIIHRDIKSANILLDDRFTAKVADFGASRLNPLDQTQISTIVQGTMGYLDPEYFHNSQLTDKSDVYSFGVVLAELLTGEKPLSFERSEDKRILATYFIESSKKNELVQLLEAGIENEEMKEQVHAAAQLAKRCLNLSGEERPSMKEVAAELEELRGFDRHSFIKQSNDNNSTLPYEEVDLYAVPTSSYSIDGSSDQYSLQNDIFSSNVPR